MAVPKQRHTKSRRNKRRSHHALSKTGLSKCSKCGRFILPHRVCPYCGHYAGREVIDVLAKLSKRERKRKEKAERKREKGEEKEEKKEKGPLSMEELSRK